MRPSVPISAAAQRSRAAATATVRSSTDQRRRSHHRGSAIAPSQPAAASSFDFHTVTCVAWSASGRNIGIGTPDGFLVYSTEPLVSSWPGNPTSLGVGTDDAATSSAPLDSSAAVREVCRCAVYGGVGLLSLHKQSSIVAFTGVRQRTAAAYVQLADISETLPSNFFKQPSTSLAPPDATGSSASRRARPWPADDDAAVADWYERWRVSAFANASVPPPITATTLAFVECPSTVAALHFCPHVVIAATSGDPNIVGSHTLHIFDHHLRPIYTLPVYPPSSNAYLKDMIAIAATTTLSNGAGMTVQRLRVMLPGEKKGEVRLLTFKKSTLISTAAYDTSENNRGDAGIDAATATIHQREDSHRHLVDRVLHQAPLRAVSITEDGKSGVTMSEQGMRIRLLDFVGDDRISERLTLDRGRLPAVTDTVSLAIVPVPQPGGQQRHLLNLGRRSGAFADRHERCNSDSSGGAATPYAYGDPSFSPTRQYQLLTEVLHDIVVCLTSSGTMHVFGCGLQQVLFHHSDKTLLPRVGYPFTFSVSLPSLLVKESTTAVFVVRSDVETSAAHYLPRSEQHRASAEDAVRTAERRRDDVASGSRALPGELFAFQLRYPSHLARGEARRALVSSSVGPQCTALVRCVLSTH